MRIEIPELAVVALVGVSSSGKSTFAKTHFKSTEVLSSDYFRALVSDDENNQQVTAHAFDALYYIANKRLELGLLTVIDATNVQPYSRSSVVRLAREQNCLAVAIVLDVSRETIKERNRNRPDRNLDQKIIERQTTQLKSSIKGLQKEGFRYVYIVPEEEINNVEIVRVPLWNNKKYEKGPFDIIGDIHGCYDELCELLTALKYNVDKENFTAKHTENRKALFLGDLCDRGPKNMEVLRIVMNMVQAGDALCVAGNHDVKLLKKLKGKNVKLTHGLDKTVEQLEIQDDDFINRTRDFLDSLISHYVLDDGALVAAHAGLKEKYHGRSSGRVREFCLYGETTGETDEYGLPVRLPWANEYRGKALVVYGHIPGTEVQNINNTVCIDTGCVFGGKLTAYRYPEKEIVQIDAKQEYYSPLKPLKNETANDDIPDINDVIGQKYLNTRLRHSIRINEENSAAALELMSRFAADPHWLIYLPPTMSPCETSRLSGYLEYPSEAFDYYKTRGIGKVICEQKHMGSRAVIVLCRDSETAAKRFGISNNSSGIIYTRTGRHFFDDIDTENAILTRLQNVLSASSFWKDFNTDWVCLDTELMPWSAKAQALLREQYAPAGCAGRGALAAAADALKSAVKMLGEKTPREKQADAGTVSSVEGNSIDLENLLEKYTEREKAIALYIDSYRRYCWEVNSIDDYRIAPFHILATEGKTWNTDDHLFHMNQIEKYMIGIDPVFIATNYLLIDLLDEQSVTAGIKWWEEITGSGGEGMVVKPLDFIAMKGNELLQSAVKCRGKEYLRIIYGPEYLLGGNLERLKNRHLGKKRSLALNEFALGMEALERFTKNEPLYRVHECVFGILALESEPVDPRL